MAEPNKSDIMDARRKQRTNSVLQHFRLMDLARLGSQGERPET